MTGFNFYLTEIFNVETKAVTTYTRYQTRAASLEGLMNNRAVNLMDQMNNKAVNFEHSTHILT